MCFMQKLFLTKCEKSCLDFYVMQQPGDRSAGWEEKFFNKHLNDIICSVRGDPDEYLKFEKSLNQKSRKLP